MNKSIEAILKDLGEFVGLGPSWITVIITLIPVMQGISALLQWYSARQDRKLEIQRLLSQTVSASVSEIYQILEKLNSGEVKTTKQMQVLVLRLAAIGSHAQKFFPRIQAYITPFDYNAVGTALMLARDPASLNYFNDSVALADDPFQKIVLCRDKAVALANFGNLTAARATIQETFAYIDQFEKQGQTVRTRGWLFAQHVKMEKPNSDFVFLLRAMTYQHEAMIESTAGGVGGENVRLIAANEAVSAQFKNIQQPVVRALAEQLLGFAAPAATTPPIVAAKSVADHLQMVPMTNGAPAGAT